MKSHKILRYLPLLLLILTPFLIADMGPKPSANFQIFYETGSTTELIVGYALYICDTPDCQDAQILEELGPQHFDCTQTACTSMAYGYGNYLYITFDFADGTSLTSNIFTKEHFDAEYEIHVGTESLKVTEIGGSNFGKAGGPLGWVIYGSIAAIICGGILVVAVIVLVIVLIVRNRRKKKAGQL